MICLIFVYNFYKKEKLILNIKLYNDNCFDIMKTLEDNSIDMIFTDPPYDIPNVTGGGR